MFKKKKTDAPVQQTTETQEFQKNIKTLWIYTTLFCLFALVLILISSFVQYKIDRRAEYYQGQYETVQSSSQSTIKNIQTENDALKKDIEKYKEEASICKEQAENDAVLLQNSALMLENAEILLDIQSDVASRNYNSARDKMQTVDTEYLSEKMLEVYNALKDKLNI